ERCAGSDPRGSLRRPWVECGEVARGGEQEDRKKGRREPVRLGDAAPEGEREEHGERERKRPKEERKNDVLTSVAREEPRAPNGEDGINRGEVCELPEEDLCDVAK